MPQFEIKESVDSNTFRNFLLNLSKNTQYTFNYFGVISEDTVNEIVDKELIRTDKLKFFSIFEENLIAYSFLTLFDKPSKKHNCILGIVISDSWQNKGFGKKICEEMINKAWKKGLEKIWLTVHTDNVQAIRLYKSLGFDFEGIFIEDEYFDGKFRNIASMALFRNKKFTVQDRLKICEDLERKLD